MNKLLNENTIPEKKLNLKRTQLFLKNNSVITVNNAVVEFHSERITFLNESSSTMEIHYFNEIDSLRYSNTNLGIISSIAGFIIVGKSIGSLFGNHKLGENFGYPDLKGTKENLVTLLSASIGAVTGYYLGSKHFIRWQTLNIEELKSEKY